MILRTPMLTDALRYGARCTHDVETSNIIEEDLEVFVTRSATSALMPLLPAHSLQPSRHGSLQKRRRLELRDFARRDNVIAIESRFLTKFEGQDFRERED